MKIPHGESVPGLVKGKPWNGVRYGCTTRAGGVSRDDWASLNLALHVGDDPAAVQENRRRLRAALPASPFWLEQVHGTRVMDADAWAAAQPEPTTPPCADAAITLQPGRVLAIMTADCIPVVISDTEGRALGAAHAGWRGLAAGVLENTLAALKARLPGAATWQAWIGPCIGQPSFEVGDEVRLAFVDHAADASVHFLPGRGPGKWQADLVGLARHRLAMAGVHHVEAAAYCTYEHAELFFSYRRSPVTGRMATVAWLEPESRHSR